MKRSMIVAIALVATIAASVCVAIPAVSAGTAKKMNVRKQVTVATTQLSPADQVKLTLLKTLYKQIADAAKAVLAKAKADKAAGKDLSAFAADLKIAAEAKTRRAVSHGIMLTESERAQLAAMQATIRNLKQQWRAQHKAKAPQAILDALKAQIKAAIAARTAYLKAIHTAALTQFSARLDTLIADANAKLAFLQNLLARLP